MKSIIPGCAFKKGRGVAPERIWRVKIDLFFMRVGFSRRGNIHGLVKRFKSVRLCLQGASEGFQKKMLTSSFFSNLSAWLLFPIFNLGCKKIPYCPLEACYMYVIYPKLKIKNYKRGFLFSTHFPPFFSKTVPMNHFPANKNVASSTRNVATRRRLLLRKREKRRRSTFVLDIIRGWGGKEGGG